MRNHTQLLLNKYGHILILDTGINNSENILINLCSSNTKSEQLNTFDELLPVLNNLELEVQKHIPFFWQF